MGLDAVAHVGGGINAWKAAGGPIEGLGTGVYAAKLAACMAHRSQFPKGEESLQWLKELDGRGGQRIGVPYAEIFRSLVVW